MNIKKHVITVILVCLLSAIPIVASVYAKLPLNLSERIERENSSDLCLTIYYSNPLALKFFPITNVEDLKESSDKKIVVNGSDLEEHIDLFRQIGIDDLKPVVIKSSYLDLREYYVLESRKNGKLLDVAMWGAGNNSMIVNGVEVKENKIFGDVIMPFLSEEEAKDLERVINGEILY